jgi:hypothetical protein
MLQYLLSISKKEIKDKIISYKATFYKEWILSIEIFTIFLHCYVPSLKHEREKEN